MDIIDESKQVTSIKLYIRFYHRNSINEAYETLALDISKVDAQDVKNA